MRRPGRWWRRKSTPAKVEAYTRWSFHFMVLVEFVTAGGQLLGLLVRGEHPGAGGPGAATALMVLVAGHCVLCGVIASRSLDWQRGRRAKPVRLLWALGVVTAGVATTAVSLVEHDRAGRDADGTALGVYVVVLAFGAGTITLGLRDRRRMLASPAGFAAGSGLVASAFGMAAPGALIVAAVVLLSAGFVTATYVLSLWLLNVVHELDEARETRTRLAVAEERLRFGRDLHDVMGRNLAVIALKSELAVQLAQRERPEAVTQMVEVQRLAQETQREVREVVRGYREADLNSELAGAKGVLTAAGIDCTVTGPPVGLPAQVQSALGWVVREAATNVLRHGDARQCVVNVRVLEGRAVLTVDNDGVPDGAGGPGRGSGLVGLRERLAEIGGTLRAGPTGDGRFLLTAEVPSSAPAGATAGAGPGAGPRAGAVAPGAAESLVPTGLGAQTAAPGSTDSRNEVTS
ncbi:sensor histidine kinase [Streptomyces sp. NPDC058625]|uniref:sensor histidine kinase n=1 Tax=Streptomyces sp. NPDC058625 TaxID=3346564 RepID=UPI00366490C8